MDIKKSFINFVALDGFRMAIQKLEKETGIENSIIIPSRSLKDIEQAKAQGGCADHIEKNFFVIHILNSLSC